MSSDGASIDHPSIGRRGDVAVLTDELALVLEEARSAEAAAMVDLDTARLELRARLQPLMDQRRAALREQLERERLDAEASVVAATRAATVMVGQATARADEARRARAAGLAAAAAMIAEPTLADDETPDAPTAAVEPPPTLEPAAEEPDAEEPDAEEPVAEEPDAEEPAVEEPNSDGVVDRLVVVPALEPADDDAVWAATAPTTVEPTVEPTVIAAGRPTTDGAGVTNIVIDAEAFARVFATTIAALMQDRQPIVVQAPLGAPVAAPVPVPPKASFWSEARHADVLLMGLATVIVIVVLAAWLA